MDLFSWQKKTNPQLANYLKNNQLDSEDEEEYISINEPPAPEQKVEAKIDIKEEVVVVTETPVDNIVEIVNTTAASSTELTSANGDVNTSVATISKTGIGSFLLSLCKHFKIFKKF